MFARITKLQEPPRSMLLGELRVITDLARMTWPLLRASRGRRAQGRATPVMVVPGYGASDAYTRPLRSYLHSHGYAAEGWSLGRNLAGLDVQHTLDDLSPKWQLDPKPRYRGEAGVPLLAEKLANRIVERHAMLGEPIALIGWSLGGYLAREAARDLPEAVDCVITLGSPVVGGPKYTASAPSFRKRGLDLDWIEREVRKREERPIVQPVTAIYSKSDAIVSWPAAIDRYNPRVRHVHMDCSHLGMIFNPSVWRIVLEALKSRPGSLPANECAA